MERTVTDETGLRLVPLLAEISEHPELTEKVIGAL